MTVLNDVVRWSFCMTFNGTAAKGSILKEERETASENWEKEHWGVITQLGAVLKEVVI